MSKGLPSRKWDDLNEGAFMRAMESLMKELNAGAGTDPRNWKAIYFISFHLIQF